MSKCAKTHILQKEKFMDNLNGGYDVTQFKVSVLDFKDKKIIFYNKYFFCIMYFLEFKSTIINRRTKEVIKIDENTVSESTIYDLMRKFAFEENYAKIKQDEKNLKNRC
ncbi:hypothetical protein [Romboutsia ilealis]|uniref:hypothetical protein n=2 Tax=Romboutsia ilealis TaxID=1115758 RepID=UPI0026F3AE7B|nr:hypothetical protein [Romboutsia ilealis]